MIFTILLAVGLACVLIAIIMTANNLRIYTIAPAASPDEAVLITVCIPARNEEANICACVDSVLAGTHRNVEVLVYNDQSTDRTGEIVTEISARDGRVRVVATAALPDGWNGKQWGCHQMGTDATGEWVLFTDADVRFSPDCLARTHARALALKAELLSTFPREQTGTLGEALIVPLIHFVLLSYLPMRRMRVSTSPAASAGCGQFLFVRREAYLASGGHAAFPASMHDGIMLPRMLRRAGHKTDLFDGTDMANCRMYRGFGQTWRGFAKNAYEGLGSVGLLIFVTVIHLLGHVLPPAYLIYAAIAGDAPRNWVALAALAVGLALLHRIWLAVRFGQSIVGALLHPVGIMLMTAIQWQSFVLAKLGRRAWRGRVQAV
ncbi:MAG: glycosyltransferase family 2 protein [Phycisphaerales bacterium]